MELVFGGDKSGSIYISSDEISNAVLMCGAANASDVLTAMVRIMIAVKYSWCPRLANHDVIFLHPTPAFDIRLIVEHSPGNQQSTNGICETKRNNRTN